MVVIYGSTFHGCQTILNEMINNQIQKQAIIYLSI